MERVCFLFLTILLSFQSASAVVPHIAQKIEELIEPKPEQVLRVKTARVVLADYALIRRDFPRTQSLSEAEIDTWLLKRTAYISEAQASQEKVNTAIEVLPESSKGGRVTAYRPEGYGRALVFKTEEGLIDAKGVGKFNNPEPLKHKNGLATLGEMIREFLFQKKIQQIFDHSGSGFQTVESYAVIDWGFDVREYDGRLLPAGAILRQAHVRPKTENFQNHFASLIDSAIIENVLRHYGVTSTGDSPTETQERVNIQNTRDGAILDFGSYLVKETFKKQLIHYGTTDVLSDPRLPTFVQPDSRLKLSRSLWGASETGNENPRFDNPWVWSHRLAEDLKSGQADRSHVSTHFYNMMNGAPLPSELQGLFRSVRSENHRESVAKELFTIQKQIHVRVLQELLELNPKNLDATFFMAHFTPDRLASVDLQSLITVLNKYGILERFPKLWSPLVLNLRENPQDVPMVLYELMNAKQGSLIESAINNSKYSKKSLEDFLSSDLAKKEKRWPKWVSAAIKKHPEFGPSFLKKEPLTAKYPQLFQEVAHHASGSRSSDMADVLEAPHWKSHPQYSEWKRQYPRAAMCDLLF